MFRTLAFVFGALALLAALGAWQSRAKRFLFIWAAASAGFAGAAAYYHVFWPLAVCGLMSLWALFSTTNVVTSTWRHKVGATLFVALGTAIALFPTVHDEMICSQSKPIDQLRSSCPEIIKQMPSEAREAHLNLAKAGDKGWTQFLLQNVPFRMVRGLDLAGGLRLVYSVQVDEAIRDKRDRAYDSLRAGLTKQLGLSTADSPTVEDMKKLGEKAKLSKPRDKADAIVVELVDPADAPKVLDQKFLTPFLRELSYSPAADKKSITFRIRNDIGSDIRSKAVQQAKDTISRRIDSLGVKEVAPSVRDEDVIIEVPGNQEKEFDRIRELISETARLEFKLLDDDANPFEKYLADPKVPKDIRLDQENAPLGKAQKKDKPRTEPRYYWRIEKLHSETMEEALARLKAWTSTLPIDEDHEIGFEKIVDLNDKEEYTDVGWRTFYLKAKAELTGDMVRDANAQSDRSDSGLGQWYVMMTLSTVGAERFEEITSANVGRRFAIILDGKVESAPVIQEAIGGGTARITMGAGNLQQQYQNAQKLVLVLKSGALPAPISLSNEQRIGALLGDDAIKDGVTGAGLGALLVLTFMFYNYRRAGLIANTAVLFNLLIQLAVLAMANASMTLPGICGLALTIGASVDSNVLINERIKEELHQGKSARSAVAIGYEKAFSAIIDGHIVMGIAGLILWQYGTGPIKGFAITLFIGLLTNLFTGVFVTKIMFEWWVRGKSAVKLSVG